MMAYSNLKMEIPNLKIVSDGTSDGTLVTVDGKELVGIQSINIEVTPERDAIVDIKVLSSDFEIETDLNQINFTELNLPKDFYKKEELK